MTVAIVRYNSGNVQSVINALERIGASYTVTDDPRELQAADRVIFPGVGEASTAMTYLKTTGLDVTIREMTQPVLGICLGMQLLCERSEEGDTECLRDRFREGSTVFHQGEGPAHGMEPGNRT